MAMTKNSANTPITEDEIRHWADSLNDISCGNPTDKDTAKDIRPARLQEVRLFDERFLALGLYRESLVWLVFDLDLKAPQIYTSENLSEFGKKESKKPLSLFMSAHFRGASLLRVELREGFGRVLWLIFAKAPDDLRELEVRLFPRGANAIARTTDKEVALRKPLPLKEMAADETEYMANYIRLNEAAKAPEKKSAAAKVEDSDWRDKKIAKLQKAIEKVAEEIKIKSDQQWAAAGEWLKTHQTLNELPTEFTAYIDMKKNLVWNIQNCFAKSKGLQKKLAGTQARLGELRKEVAETREMTQPKMATVKASSKLLSQADARGRTFALDDGFFLFVGKSAADNLKLLREAKPWHYWLHLRDSPGSHGILVRNKNQVVGDAILQRAAHHLLATQFGDKSGKYNREKFAILVAECRFVRPIRGDRLGQVTHTDARTFLHQFNAKNS
jgi:hypothetical protein